MNSILYHEAWVPFFKSLVMSTACWIPLVSRVWMSLFLFCTFCNKDYRTYNNNNIQHTYNNIQQTTRECWKNRLLFVCRILRCEDASVIKRIRYSPSWVVIAIGSTPLLRALYFRWNANLFTSRRINICTLCTMRIWQQSSGRGIHIGFQQPLLIRLTGKSFFHLS